MQTIQPAVEFHATTTLTREEPKAGWMSISELSKNLNIEQYTLRNWEKILDIPISHRVGSKNTRYYDRKAILTFERIKFYVNDGYKLKNIHKKLEAEGLI